MAQRAGWLVRKSRRLFELTVGSCYSHFISTKSTVKCQENNLQKKIRRRKKRFHYATLIKKKKKLYQEQMSKCQSNISGKNGVCCVNPRTHLLIKSLSLVPNPEVFLCSWWRDGGLFFDCLSLVATHESYKTSFSWLCYFWTQNKDTLLYLMLRRLS